MNPIDPANTGSTPYYVPPEPKRWRALTLATAVHASLFLFLWAGVRWQNTVPVAVEAEVWDMQTRAAAPPPEPVPEPVEPEPAEVKPEPAPPPPPVAQAQVEPPAAVKPPDIALERRKEKLKLEKRQQAEAAILKAQQKQDALDQAAALAREKAKQQEDVQHKQEVADKKLADKLAKDSKAKEQVDAQRKKDIADKKLADKLAKDKSANEEKAIKDMRAEQMRRITGSGGNGDAPKSTAPHIDSGYVASITRKIKGNIAYSGSTDVEGKPRAVFKISQLPTGEIISIKQNKESGIDAYDKAVENAINKSSPLPKKKDGTVERDLELIFDMKDLP